MRSDTIKRGIEAFAPLRELLDRASASASRRAILGSPIARISPMSW
jgi:hypothetical protein